VLGGKNLLAYLSHKDKEWQAVRKSVAAAFSNENMKKKVVGVGVVTTMYYQ